MTLAVILPASNEAALIGGCLEALLASDWPWAAPLETVVVANGCRDDTAERARHYAEAFEIRGWRLVVLELAEGGKLGALNAGDAATCAPVRLYLDADVTLSPPLLAQPSASTLTS